SSGEDRLRRLTEDRPDHAVEALRQPRSLDDLPRLAELSAQIVASILADQERTLISRKADSAAVPSSIRERQIVKEVGQGGMGHVYLARHERLQREVALKLLPANLAADPQFRGRFEREMAVIGQMGHPNLVRAYDAGVADGRLFLVMELLDGSDLSALV